MVLSVRTSAAGASARRRTVLRQPRSHGGASERTVLPPLATVLLFRRVLRAHTRSPAAAVGIGVRAIVAHGHVLVSAGLDGALAPRWLAARRSNGCPCGCVRTRAVASSLDGVSPRPADLARCAALQASRACGTSRKGRSWQSAGATLARQALQQPRQPFGSLTARNGGGRTLYIAHRGDTNHLWRICLRGYTNAAWDR